MATKEHDAARKDAVRMRVRAFDDADDEDAEASTPKMAPARKRKPPRQGAMSSFLLELQAVSYTHLTLPTICSV